LPRLRIRISRLTPLALALVAVLSAGCGREQPPDLVNGKQLFAGKATCGSCHTLARAGTKGTQGPNLDYAFGTARRDGLGQKTVEGVVKRQIANVRRGSIMPKNLVTGDDARDVAAYVALVAGQPGQDTGELAAVGGAAGANKTAAEKAGTLTIPADSTGALAFGFGKATATAGKLTLVMPNPSPIQHNIAIKGDGNGPVVGSGGKSTFSVTLKKGTYEYYCEVPGHEAGGMKGTLTVK
jgi:plastocyanin